MGKQNHSKSLLNIKVKMTQKHLFLFLVFLVAKMQRREVSIPNDYCKYNYVHRKKVVNA